jgi:hypothetical protein
VPQRNPAGPVVDVDSFRLPNVVRDALGLVSALGYRSVADRGRTRLGLIPCNTETSDPHHPHCLRRGQRSTRTRLHRQPVRRMTRLGTDVVGGIPWIESSAADALAHVRFCFDLAEKFDMDVSMLLDDVVDPNMRTLEMMATEAIRRGWQGHALAHHCRAMALYPQPVFHEMVDLLRRARVAIVSDPHTGPLHARGKELPPFPEVRSARLGPPPLADRQQSWCLQRPGARCLHV